MSGTKEGGQKATKTLIARYGKEFYKEIGSIGGSKSLGGFKSGDPRAKSFGKKGGAIGRKGYKFIRRQGDLLIYRNNKTGTIETKQA